MPRTTLEKEKEKAKAKVSLKIPVNRPRPKEPVEKPAPLAAPTHTAQPIALKVAKELDKARATKAEPTPNGGTSQDSVKTEESSA